MILKRGLIFILGLLAFQAGNPAISQDYGYKTSSVLKDGLWSRIAVVAPGIYRLSYSDLRNMGITDPANVSVYGNNHGQLSFYNNDQKPDDLKKIAIKLEKGSDNVFGENDYLIFYAEGTHRWKYSSTLDKYEFSRQYYSDTAYYFITSKTGDAIYTDNYQQPSASPDYISTSHDVCYRYEKDAVNLLGSGREWYQSAVNGLSYSINPDFNDVILNEAISYKVRVLGRSDTQVSFSFNQGENNIRTITPSPVNLSDINGLYASSATVEGTTLPSSGSPTFTLTFSNGGNISGYGWIDYVDLHARALSKYSQGQMFMSDTRTIAPGHTTKYVIESTSQPIVWDITDPFNPMSLQTTFTNGQVSFNASGDSLRKYILFNTGSILTPVIFKGTVSNQDLHAPASADMIIVTHPSFLVQAQRLADIHLQNDGLTSIIVTPQQIYNEFSGGIPDAAAIRNYVKMIWDRSKGTTQPLKFLLLFGDGSFDNKNKTAGNTNYILTWQSINSTTAVQSFTSDDFYGLLDEGEGEAEGYLDIGIGRLPVDNTTDARVLVDKIQNYISTSSFGSWRNTLCMVADDEDNNLHMNDAENLSSLIADEAPMITNEKIYFDAYRQVSSISGNTYPDATKAINNRIEDGCLILNYIGHGSESGLAHERVIKPDDITSWANSGKLPLFITATCEFSRFDNVNINASTGEISAKTSAGEMVLLNPNGGGIALMSTTRVVYSAPNYTLNSNIIDYAFNKAADGSSMRFGDIIRLAKINSGSGTNKFNFMLLGDPAVRLAWPENGNVVTDSINGVSIESVTDTLKALSLITISGHIEDESGNLAESFNGTVEPVVFDKPTKIKTLANDGGETMEFEVPGSTIYKGSAKVTEGQFSFSFIVPIDINYSYGNGRITYYAHNDQIDVNGFTDKIIIGGFSDNQIDDSEGPVIKLFMNDTLFSDGDITDTDPTLLAIISDKSGINTTGTSIGHDIVAWFDGNTAESVVLNSLFSSDQSGISTGSLRYPFSINDKGPHYVTLRAWDNLNNFSEKTLHFSVESDGAFLLTNLLCYPNPAISETNFSISHNRPNEEINITITIYNASGNIIRILNDTFESSGYKIPDIQWDGCNESGSHVARGLYIWKVEAVTSQGERKSASGRVVIL
jgi:hypothetical protein